MHVGNASLSKFDVLVIGSGAGGSAVAGLLAGKGQKVLVLEAGRNLFVGLDDAKAPPKTRFANDELAYATRNAIVPDPVVEPRTWRNSPSDGDRTYVGDVNTLPKTVGGGCVHADLKMPRFQVDDFHLGTLLGPVPNASFADWPVDYDMLEPFYAYVETALGIQGESGTNPFEAPRKTPFPMPPGVPMYSGLKVSDGAKKLGLHPFAYPMAVNSRPYMGRPACVDCGFCSGFGCPSHAKGSTAITMLRSALVSGNCQLLPETRAAKLLVDGAGTTVTGVEAILPDGTRRVFTADRYVLAASPIEDARLLLLSGGIGNASDQVGRNLTFHFQPAAAGVFEERTHGHRGRTVTHGFSDFRGVPNDPSRPLGGIVEISGSEGPIAEAAYILRVMKAVTGGRFDGPRFKRLLRQSPFRQHVVALALQAEDAPQATNRVDLDPAVRDLDGLPVARCTYQNHPFELSARKVYTPKLIELLGASGAKWATVLPADDIPGSAHVMGTLRMGTDAKTSVCDPSGRLHDVGNLYVADGALFPTSSGFNPTLTIVALATRVAAAMLSPDAPERMLS